MSRWWSKGMVVGAVMALGLAGCANPAGEAPPAPAMPAGWSVTVDQAFADADIKPVEERLGGDIKTLRNTTYEVNGRPIKLNCMVAASPAEADKLMAGMAKIKPAEFFFRKGDTIYEFVAADDALADLRAGRAHLE